MDARISALEQARRIIPEVSSDEAWAELEAGTPALLLDVREAHEWRKGYIDGAVRIALDEVPDKADPQILDHDPALTDCRDGRIIVYCATGVRSLLGGLALHRLGYSNVASLAGGIEGWKQAGHPTLRI
ncbi:MAG: rhodanese-like domain-containing protein [Actinomycetota bacterium]